MVSVRKKRAAESFGKVFAVRLYEDFAPAQDKAVTPDDFKRWRKALKLSQKEAAESLGLKRRVVQYYEKGERDGEKVEVPRTVRLACYALAAGIEDYQGPDPETGKVAKAALRDSKVRKKLDPDGIENLTEG